MTEPLFRDDAYLSACEARVLRAEPGAIVLDRTVFYPTGGGQPGDRGRLELEDGTAVEILEARKGEGAEILHVAAAEAALPPVGTAVRAVIDWDRRHRLMRTHTALHLLCRAVGGAVTGGAVGELKGRLDFDLPEPPDRDAIEARIDAWIEEDHAVDALCIDEAELAARPELVRTLSVRPPSGSGRIRLVRIEGVDLQACGGTHVRSTREIGRVAIGKVEKKGRINRRIAIEIAG